MSNIHVVNKEKDNLDSFCMIADYYNVSFRELIRINTGKGKGKGNYSYENRDPKYWLNNGDIVFLPKKQPPKKEYGNCINNNCNALTNLTSIKEKKPDDKTHEKDYLHVLVLVPGTTAPVNDLFLFLLGDENESSHSSRSGFSYWDECFIEDIFRLKKKIVNNNKDNVHFNFELYTDFSWTGDNSHVERVMGGKRLARELNRKYSSLWSSNEVFFHLIGHSHGGNVINAFTNEISKGSIFFEKWYVKTIVYLSTPFFKKIEQPDASKLHKSVLIFNIKNKFDLTQRFIADFSIIPSFKQATKNINDLLSTIKNIKNKFEPFMHSLKKYVQSLKETFDIFIISPYTKEAEKLFQDTYNRFSSNGNELKGNLKSLVQSVNTLINSIIEYINGVDDMPSNVKQETKSALKRIKEMIDILSENAKFVINEVTNLELRNAYGEICDFTDQLLQILASFAEHDWIIRVIVLFSINMLDYFDNTVQTNDHYEQFELINISLDEVQNEDKYIDYKNMRDFDILINKIEENEKILEGLFVSDFSKFKQKKWDNFEKVSSSLTNIFCDLIAQIISKPLLELKNNIEISIALINLIKNSNVYTKYLITTIDKSETAISIKNSMKTIFNFIERMSYRDLELFKIIDSTKSYYESALDINNPGTLGYFAMISHSVSRQKFSKNIFEEIVKNVQ
ncbi:hypothetical protein MHK_007471 [Candidatus Magnetomorum sp. HK-1]|nr:hypothetical protein MHK_007471 [Candidatus Magnetomorum sp. HK-1]